MREKTTITFESLAAYARTISIGLWLIIQSNYATKQKRIIKMKDFEVDGFNVPRTPVSFDTAHVGHISTMAHTASVTVVEGTCA